MKAGGHPSDTSLPCHADSMQEPAMFKNRNLKIEFLHKKLERSDHSCFLMVMRTVHNFKAFAACKIKNLSSIFPI